MAQIHDNGKIFDPRDGLEINMLRWGSNISWYRWAVSEYDQDMIFDDGVLTSRGIAQSVRKINRYKSIKVNSYKHKINKRA